MLQNVRDNLKGTTAAVVIAVLVVPLVVTGFSGSSFLSNVAGTKVAKVNKRSISSLELDRAMSRQKSQLEAQGVEQGSDQLKDENLRGPVLKSLTDQAALITAAEKSGMGISEKQVFTLLRDLPRFQVNGKFDAQSYQRQIAAEGYTPTTYKEFIGDILLIQQEMEGVRTSTLVPEAEVDAVIAITQEQRSFSVVTVPASGRIEEIQLSEEEVAEYYQANQGKFVEQEQMSVYYLELSVDELMQGIEVSQADIQQRYDEEKAAFELAANESEIQIAHLMVEKQDDGAEAALLTEISERLSNGDDFAELVKQYSADEGSREVGGDLGVLIKGTFSEEFETAAQALAEGEVSAPVETDSAYHFIKSLSRVVVSFPSLDDKQAGISKALQRELAEEIYANTEQSLEDLTFSAKDLEGAATTLNLSIKESGLFQRGQGEGVTQTAAVRNAAFVDGVRLDGRNSPKIQLAPGHAIVLRKKEHLPEHIKALDIVRDSIVSTLKEEKLAAIMAAETEAFIAEIQAETEADLKALSEKKGYTFSEHLKVKRFEAPVDFQARTAVFELPAPAAGLAAYKSVKSANGDYLVLRLTEVIKGTREGMPEQQIAGLKAQLQSQNANTEMLAYQGKLVADAKIKLY